MGALLVAGAAWAHDDAPRRQPLRTGAETIFVGGDVVTVDDARPEAEALAVRDGVIVAVGSTDEVLAWRVPETEVVDLAGGALLPGFIEAHTHPIASAVLGQWVDVSGFTHRSATEVWGALEAAVAAAPPGAFVLGFGYDPVLVRDLRTPTMAELDALAPENPVMLLAQMMHLGFANGRAFAAVGITPDTPAPKGGAFPLDAEGRLMGTIVEAPALLRFTAGMPQVPRAAYRQLVRRQYRAYAAHGYTTITAMGQVPFAGDPLRLLQEAADESGSPIRVHAYVFGDGIAGVPFGPGFGSDRFTVRGVKLLIDGSPYAGGMATREPYLDTALTREGMGLAPGSRGHVNYTREQLTAAVERFHRDGWQIALHVQGGRAIDLVLDVFEDVLARFPRADHRHRLEHNALITEEQLARAARLGMTPSFFINHVYYYGRGLADAIVGPERAARFMPMGSAKRLGHRFSLHTDNPASPLGPFHAMRAAVTRRMRDGGAVLGPDQRITIDDAIKAVTFNAAWQIFEEDRRGSLEVGKVADLVLLSANPRRADPEQLPEIAVVATYLAGRRVDAGPGAPAGAGHGE